jgi:hypothetical protein
MNWPNADNLHQSRQSNHGNRNRYLNIDRLGSALGGKANRFSDERTAQITVCSILSTALPLASSENSSPKKIEGVSIGDLISTSGSGRTMQCQKR